MKWLAFTFGAVGLCALILFLWRLSDRRAENATWEDLLGRAGPAGPAFDISVIDALPEPAQRYFLYTIAPGTPLVSAVEIDMHGQLGLGTKDAPAYRAMTAKQILAPPIGLVWKVDMGAISGSDGATPETSWTRFWLLDFIPLARISGNTDHHRSAFGRVVSEGAFWVPASLLPNRNVSWEAVDQNSARALVSFGTSSQSIELTVEADGQPSRVVIQRWSNENSDGEFREQPFGGYLSEFRMIGGYRLPMHVEGGNLIGTQDYFPFYRADVQRIRFPQLDSGFSKAD
jgi:hypothetical protein